MELNKKANNQMILSIVVSTTGIRSELKECLESLQESKNVEVLVINNSRRKFIESDFKVINELKLGISYARNTGWKKAKGEYVAYIDDDSIAHKDWIKNILKFIRNNPNIEVFGGPYTKHSHIPIPSWIPLNFGTMSLGNKKKKINVGIEFLSGSNMIFKKNVLRKVGGFSPKIGMKRNKISYGDETELQMRLSKKNIDIFYDPKIKVSHLFDKRKMYLIWVLKDGFIRGRSIVQIKKLHPELSSINKDKTSLYKQKSNNSFIQEIVYSLHLFTYACGVLFERFLKK